MSTGKLAHYLSGIANSSLRVDCFRNQYLLGGRTTLHVIANGSLRVDCFRNQYHRVLLDGRTILSGIANSSPRVDCFRNLYHRVRRVTPRWAYDLHGITNNPLRVDTSIAGYC